MELLPYTDMTAMPLINMEAQVALTSLHLSHLILPISTLLPDSNGIDSEATASSHSFPIQSAGTLWILSRTFLIVFKPLIGSAEQHVVNATWGLVFKPTIISESSTNPRH
jgi:hypothetical protein